MNRSVISLKTKSTTHYAVTAIVFSVLLTLPSCAIPKLHLPEPGRPMPETFNGMITPENSAEVSFEDFFTDPMLTTLISEALVGNQQLRILGQDIRIANNEVRRRRGAYLPFVSGGLTNASITKYSYNTIEGADNLMNVPSNGTHFPTPLPDFMVAADVSWQIDIWRQLRNARDAAGRRYLGTIDGRNYALTRLIAEIAENYYTLMALDKRLENLDIIITLQEQSLEIAKARKEAARGTELAVQRFQAEVRKNQSEKLIIYQNIIEVENRINFLVGRFPQRIERQAMGFLDLTLPPLSVGVPAQLLQNRPDIRQAERELEATGLDVRVARANFYPKVFLTAYVGYEAYNTKYLFLTPESLIYNAAGSMVAPLINKTAIRADYLNANAKQLQAVYDYQRTVINAVTEVVNRVAKVQNYSVSLQIKRQQLESLELAVNAASNLFQNARVEYIDVLFAQRDLNDARVVLIETKKEQLSAIVNAYQALGGGAGAYPSFLDYESLSTTPEGTQVIPPSKNTKAEELPMPPK